MSIETANTDKENDKTEKKIIWMHDKLIIAVSILALAVGCLTGWYLHKSVILIVQNGIFFGTLAYASVMDFRTHLVPNQIHAIIFGLGLLGLIFSLTKTNILSVILGAVILPLPFLIANAIEKKHKSHTIGCGDIKFMAAVGFLLGFKQGYTALLSGLVAAVIISAILLGCKKIDKSKPFALIPYLSVGCILSYYI